ATSPPGTYPLSLHDALPISAGPRQMSGDGCLPIQDDWADFARSRRGARVVSASSRHRRSRGSVRPLTYAARMNAVQEELPLPRRSEEHTSELQSLAYLVCRL